MTKGQELAPDSEGADHVHDNHRRTVMACGVLLVAWIAVQLLVLQQVFFLQPVIAAIGALEIWLVRQWQPERI